MAVGMRGIAKMVSAYPRAKSVGYMGTVPIANSKFEELENTIVLRNAVSISSSMIWILIQNQSISDGCSHNLQLLNSVISGIVKMRSNWLSFEKCEV
jgi:hypothetical protein